MELWALPGGRQCGVKVEAEVWGFVPPLAVPLGAIGGASPRSQARGQSLKRQRVEKLSKGRRFRRLRAKGKNGQTSSEQREF